MIRRPPRSTRTDTLFPHTTLFRSRLFPLPTAAAGQAAGQWYSARRLRPLRLCPSLKKATTAIGSTSEEPTSELQSLLRPPYAVLCLQKKTRYDGRNTCTQSRSEHVRHHITNTHRVLPAQHT